MPLRGLIECSVKGTDVFDFSGFEPRMIGLKIWWDAEVSEVYRKQKMSRRGEASELGGRHAVL